MSPLSIRSFTLFREEQPVRDALVLFTLTLLLHFFGAMLRLVQELSFFWPLNAVMAGIFARYIWLNRSYFYAVCFAAMLVYDGLTSRWGMGFASFLINFSNIVFIVTLAQLILWDKRRADSMPGPINALSLFCYCLLAALLCAAVGCPTRYCWWASRAAARALPRAAWRRITSTRRVAPTPRPC